MVGTFKHVVVAVSVAVGFGASIMAPASAAVDHIYWANSGGNAIGRANLDGSSPGQSFIGATNPTGVASDGTYVYWTVPGSNAIGRANADGSGVNQTFIVGGNQPIGVAVDGAHIYWTNFLGTTIGRAKLSPKFLTNVCRNGGTKREKRGVRRLEYEINAGTKLAVKVV